MQWQVLFGVGGWCNVSPSLAAVAAARGNRVRLVGRWQAFVARLKGRVVAGR